MYFNRLGIFQRFQKHMKCQKGWICGKKMSSVNYHPYNDVECEKMIRNNFPEKVLLAYQKLIPGAFKSDLWRLCALYINGGLYIDTHIKPVSTKIETIVSSYDYIFCIDYPTSPYYIYNAFMKAPKNSPLIMAIIDEIVNNVRIELVGKLNLEYTGPGLHGNVIKNILSIDKFVEGVHKFGDKTILFLSHKMVCPLSLYYLCIGNDPICGCRYANYRQELVSICKKPHYSILIRNNMLYNKNIIIPP